jgi:hypothetical protein
MSEKDVIKKLDEMIEVLRENKEVLKNSEEILRNSQKMLGYIQDLIKENNELIEENNGYKKHLAEIRAKRESEKELQAEDYRNSMYEQWKTNIAYEIKNNKINWVEKARVFKFSDSIECKQWLEARLRENGLI